MILGILLPTKFVIIQIRFTRKLSEALGIYGSFLDYCISVVGGFIVTYN